jgi:hypothetical protein
VRSSHDKRIDLFEVGEASIGGAAITVGWIGLGA